MVVRKHFRKKATAKLYYELFYRFRKAHPTMLLSAARIVHYSNSDNKYQK